MTQVIQFVVLKRENKWAVKSGDLERLFATQREAVDVAIRFANDSGKEGKPGAVLFQKSKSNSKRFGHTERIATRPRDQICPRSAGYKSQEN
jgi:hypothetical protein